MDDLAEFRSAVEATATRAEVRDAVHGVYAALQDAIELRRPVCVTSGRCCRFEEYGHRLFVTTMEMAAFVGDLGGQGSIADSVLRWGGRGCPFQEGGLCSVHEIRPFGCRIFFCDATSTQWQSEQYERFHKELKRLHESLGVPYFYVEWRAALRSLTTNPANL